jgi:predicted transcriptional regulator
MLSIHPNYAREIFNGHKRYEYRKRIFKKPVNLVVVYVTRPTGLIVGEFSIKSIIEDTPEKIWDQTKNASGIIKKDYDAYFKGYEKGYAIEIEEVIQYDQPINPYKIWETFVAPQNYKYLSEGRRYI